MKLGNLTAFTLDFKTYRLLEQVAEILHEEDLGKVLEYIIIGFHVLITSGVWKVLRPLPELAREVLRE